MKILIDGRPIVNQFAGVGNYVYNLVNSLANVGENDEFDILSFTASGGALGRKQSNFHLKKLNYNFKRAYTILFDVLNVPLIDCFGHYDVIHQTFPGNLNTLNKSTRIISTVHDIAFLLYPEYFERNNFEIASRVLKRQLCVSDRIIADSGFTKAELVSKCNVAPDRIDVIYPGVNQAPTHRHDAAAAERVKIKYGIGSRYLLFIGTIEPRKNIVNLVRAFSTIKQDDLQLVIVGRKGWYYDEVFSEVDRLRLGKSIIFTGYIPDHEKGLLLSEAWVFVFPSIYEGFGFPVLEAMTYGLPVIAGNNSTMPEVVGEAGLLLDNVLDVDQISNGIDQLLKDDDLRLRFAQKAIDQSKQFSWDRTALETLAVYRRTQKE